MNRITVFCGSNNGLNPNFKEAAYSMGQTMALRGINLVYGGARVGLMGAVADGILDNNGKVYGVIPRFLQEKELAHNHITETFVVETMHERKAKMSELCDGIIALPGGFGTFEELFEMLTWAQLGLHKKPIGILNTDGYYDTLLKFIDETIAQHFVKEEYRNLFVVSDNPDKLIELMKAFRPPLNDKWFVTT
ncbi:MAG: TIGR00730 family Rossman fold protein [Dysgonomonas sp.]